ncbi:MAG TPA: lysozyme inhibitor LprI family protein [Chthoniobacterales bacterium]|jgi:uncharacterized protein YecT (DUF1311 family)|nr:lysozyme inhibitor LprI family protein [Chthoniobacterales bacterium]
MKRPMRCGFLAAAIALAIAGTAWTSSYGQDPNFKPPGSEEQAAVDRANAELDKVYKQLMSKLGPEQQKSLKEAQRAWIKWRDAEADIIARVGGAVGGSAMRVDYSNAQARLIKERIEVLRGYLKESESNR